MRKVVISKVMKFIDNGSYSKNDLEKIQYGLECLYILITKGIVIFTIAYFLRILKLTLCFTLFFGLIRSFAGGLHAKGSISCLISSAILFICLPYICKILSMTKVINIMITGFSTLIIYLYAPADTHKKPIVNKKKRKFRKKASIIISLIYILLSLILKESFILNCISISILLEAIMVSPLTYSLFKLPYNNYKNYLSSEV